PQGQAVKASLIRPADRQSWETASLFLFFFLLLFLVFMLFSIFFFACLLTVPLKVLPDDGSALAQADAHCREPVLDLRSLCKRVHEMAGKPDPRRGEGMPEGNRAAVNIQPRIVRELQAEFLHECHSLDCESFVHLNEP